MHNIQKKILADSRSKHVKAYDSLKHDLPDVLDGSQRPAPLVRKVCWMEWVPVIGIGLFGFVNPLGMVWVWLLKYWFQLLMSEAQFVAHLIMFNAVLFIVLSLPQAVATGGQHYEIRQNAMNRVILLHVAISVIGGCLGLVGIVSHLGH